MAFLPPMSGVAANETRLDEGAIDVRIGEGRTAEVLRNLCWNAYQSNPDRLKIDLQNEPSFVQCMLKRREIENYLLHHETLRQWAKDEGTRREGELFSNSWETLMTSLIDELDRALKTLSRPDSQSPDIKATDDFLDPLFKKLYESKGLPLLMRKTDYHVLVPFVPVERIDPEIVEVLDQIVDIASRARPSGSPR